MAESAETFENVTICSTCIEILPWEGAGIDAMVSVKKRIQNLESQKLAHTLLLLQMPPVHCSLPIVMPVRETSCLYFHVEVTSCLFK